MKKILFSVVLMLFYVSIYAQYTTIKTPTNVSIEAINFVEYSANDLAQLEAEAADWISNHSSNAVKVAPASGKYNCHNFAWHSTDGGSKVWINQNNQYGAANLSKYWSGTSPTFVQTTSSKATKAFYANGDHSAKVVSPSVFESKWGDWPRYRHSPTDCPYVSTNIQYYYVPLSGDNLICSSKTYTVLNISSATYNWSGDKVVFSGNGSSITATKTSDGSGWIQTKISSPYSGTTVATENKTIWVGTRTPGPITISFNAPPRRISASINPVPDASTYKWYLDGVLKYTDSRTDAIFQRQLDNCDHVYYIDVAAINACGTSDISHAEVSEDPCYYGFSIFPNPASDNITITIGSEKNMASSSSVNATDAARLTSKFILTSAYTVRIIDNFGALKATLKKSGETVTIPISNLRDGIYIVEINDGVNIYRQQLLVKH